MFGEGGKNYLIVENNIFQIEGIKFITKSYYFPHCTFHIYITYNDSSTISLKFEDKASQETAFKKIGDALKAN